MQVLIKGMQPLAKKKDKNYYDVLSRALKLTSQAADKFTFPYWVQIQKNKMSLVCDNCRRASLRFQGHNFCCFVLVLNAKTYLLAFPAYWKQMLALLPWCVGAAGSSTWFSVRLYIPLLSEGVPRGLSVAGKTEPSAFLAAATGLWVFHLLRSELH